MTWPPPPSPTRRKIRETLNNLIMQSPQDWQTSVALPFVRIEGTTVEWDVRAETSPLLTCPSLAPHLRVAHHRLRRNSDSTFVFCNACR